MRIINDIHVTYDPGRGEGEAEWVLRATYGASELTDCVGVSPEVSQRVPHTALLHRIGPDAKVIGQ